MLKLSRNNYTYTIIAAFMLVTMGYVMVNGENIYLQIHDNLESNIAWLKILKNNGLFWKTGVSVPFHKEYDGAEELKSGVQIMS